MTEKKREYIYDPAELALLYSEEWSRKDVHVPFVGVPFSLRDGDPDARHILSGPNEYLVVRGAEPYGPQGLWNRTTRKYQLALSAQSRDVSVFNVPEDTITLASIVNDAIVARPDVVIGVFGAIGDMLKDIQRAAEDEEVPSIPRFGLQDIAFIKGRQEPLLLPSSEGMLPFDWFEPGIELAGDMLASSPLPLNQEKTLHLAFDNLNSRYYERSTSN